jgi:hypothetical protein
MEPSWAKTTTGSNAAARKVRAVVRCIKVLQVDTVVPKKKERSPVGS